MYKEIIEKNFTTILNLYLKHNYKKSKIAYKLIKDLDLDYTASQVDSFRRAVNQALLDWEEEHPNFDIDSLNLPKDESDYKFDDYDITRAKVLVLDIETSPIIGAFWGLHKQYINIDQIFTDSRLICWAGKWLFEPDMLGDVITPEEAKENHLQDTANGLWSINDERIVKSLWEVMNKADIIIAHNGRRFDTVVANTFFLRNGLNPPAPYQTIDTLDSAKRTFRFPSNKLDYINRALGLRQKDDTDFLLWIHCMEGREESLQRMFRYCMRDVGILEEHYVAVRAWIKSHPNLGFYCESDGIICPVCGNDNLTEIGHYDTLVNQYASFRCDKCGGISRSRRSSTTVEKKNHLMVSVAK